MQAPRYWPHFAGAREVVTLDGTWSFGLLRSPTPFDSMGAASTILAQLTPNTTSVPSCFDAAGMGELGSRGVAFYRTSFQHPGKTPFLLNKTSLVHECLLRFNPT